MNTILHLGLGAFHRAHQAAYLHELHKRGMCDWWIVGANIRNDTADVMSALIAQRGQYTLETVSPEGERHYERIRSIQEVIPFDRGFEGVLDVGGDSATRIISFTVTEAGYCLDSRNQLDLAHPDVRADFAGERPIAIYGVITAILRRRRERGGAPVTLLSCDNLRSNGARFRAALLAFLAHRGEYSLIDWVRTNTTSPCDMVDRITPRPSIDVAQRVKAATGWDDRAAVMGEQFIQWVIEDDFIAGRPAWEEVGAELVTSVHAQEEAKIRILNATHSCLAWAGALRGLTYIHEDMGVPQIRQMAYDYVTNDVIPCLDSVERPSPVDLRAYRDVVLQRFGNPYVRDTNQRVASDGLAKVMTFVLPTIRDRLAQAEGIASVARLPALLLAVLERAHFGGLPFEYRDSQLSPELLRALSEATDPVEVFVHERGLWGDLAGNETLRAALSVARNEVRDFAQA